MEILRTAIEGVLIVRPRRWGDHRGYFAPVFRAADLAAAGVTHGWVQENQSLSRSQGTVRGLHFQRPPFAQAKLARVIRGAALNVCVDLRAGSDTFGRHVAVTLAAEDLAQVYVPAGFAHGVCTLCDDTEVLYKVSAPWSEAHEGGVRYNDPALGIVWPVAEEEVVVSARDTKWPSFTAVGLHN